MNLFGYKVSLHLKIRKNGSGIVIDPDFQRRVLGSHSQYFEDVFLASIFRNREKGFYLDIGANDPDELNNTKSFYEKGWRGINVEPNRLLYQRFLERRPEDINLNVGVGDSESTLTFYEMDPHTLSTFNKDEIPESVKKHSARLVAEKQIPVVTMKSIFENHVQGRKVDFASIDTEGYEHQVLSGNDWEKYRPAVVVMEVDHDRQKRLSSFLESVGYRLVYHNGLNGMYADRQEFA